MSDLVAACDRLRGDASASPPLSSAALVAIAVLKLATISSAITAVEEGKCYERG